MRIERPSAGEYDPYYQGYVSRIAEDDVLPLLARQPGEIRTALASVSEEQSGFRYAPGKWTVREVIGHLIDTERVFGYRAMSIARGEAGALPGFDENAYTANAGHDRCRLSSLVDEFDALRRSHVALFLHLDREAAARIGTANGRPISVRALSFIMVGHARHHLATLASRYGVGVKV